jgi:hypothetical protein
MSFHGAKVIVGGYMVRYPMGGVALNTGWFGDRSAMYMACGRPVAVQDTGFSRKLPIGEGVFAVSTVSEAAEAIDAISSRPAFHGQAARDIAVEYFDAPRVMQQVLVAAGV